MIARWHCPNSSAWRGTVGFRSLGQNLLRRARVDGGSFRVGRRLLRRVAAPRLLHFRLPWCGTDSFLVAAASAAMESRVSQVGIRLLDWTYVSSCDLSGINRNLAFAVGAQNVLALQ